MTQARLPSQLFENTIGEMPIGARGYTVPWAMWPDADGLLWLNGHYTLQESPGGTVDMEVTRLEDGYEVRLGNGHCRDYKWSVGSADDYMGGADAVPVTSLLQS